MDLTKAAPRSPYETLGGIVFLPRAIDKMRAHLARTKGEYNSHAGTSERMLRVLFGITPDEFEAIVREHGGTDGVEDNQAVLDELRRRAPISTEDVEDWNQIALFSGPLTQEDWDEHWQRLEASGHGHRREIVTQFDRLDLDEGRDVPTGGRRAQLQREQALFLRDGIRARRPAAAGT
jgi:hypothetical protein